MLLLLFHDKFFTHRSYTPLNGRTGNHRTKAGQQIDFYCLRLSKKQTRRSVTAMVQIGGRVSGRFQNVHRPRNKAPPKCPPLTERPSSEKLLQRSLRRVDHHRHPGRWQRCKTEESTLHPGSSHQTLRHSVGLINIAVIGLSLKWESNISTVGNYSGPPLFNITSS